MIARGDDLDVVGGFLHRDGLGHAFLGAGDLELAERDDIAAAEANGEAGGAAGRHGDGGGLSFEAGVGDGEVARAGGDAGDGERAVARGDGAEGGAHDDDFGALEVFAGGGVDDGAGDGAGVVLSAHERGERHEETRGDSEARADEGMQLGGRVHGNGGVGWVEKARRGQAAGAEPRRRG